jgi:hypothetical protein
MGILPGRRAGTKRWEVGKEERMKGWLRAGTWRMAQPRGTYSHLVNEVSVSRNPEGREDILLRTTDGG